MGKNKVTPGVKTIDVCLNGEDCLRAFDGLPTLVMSTGAAGCQAFLDWSRAGELH